jgi:hypothetical protein
VYGALAVVAKENNVFSFHENLRIESDLLVTNIKCGASETVKP